MLCVCVCIYIYTISLIQAFKYPMKDCVPNGMLDLEISLGDGKSIRNPSLRSQTSYPCHGKT